MDNSGWKPGTKRVFAVGLIAHVVFGTDKMGVMERTTYCTLVSEIMSDEECAAFCDAERIGDSDKLKTITQEVKEKLRARLDTTAQRPFRHVPSGI